MKLRFFALMAVVCMAAGLEGQVTTVKGQVATIKFGLNINSVQSLNGQPPDVSFDSYRFWDDGSQWPNINTAQGYYNFSVTTSWLNMLRQAGVTDVLFELGRTPPWASTNPSNWNCDYSGYGGPGQCAPPLGLNSNGTGSNQIWRQWCKAVGQYFSQNSDILVAAWSPWNEFTRQTPSNAWSGTNAQMVRLAQDARAILLGRGTITATGETAQQVLESVGLSSPAYSRYAESAMLSPSTAGWENNQGEFFQYLATPGASAASEIFALHLYAWSSQKAMQLYSYFRQQTNYPNTPAWNTESSWYGTTLEQDAGSYVKDLFVDLADAGVTRSYWYGYLWYSPLYSGNELTEAGNAWQEAFSWFH
ncbi:MAG TPA: hypothetical protein VF753_17775 [Terriglobales bacterium]